MKNIHLRWEIYGTFRIFFLELVEERKLFLQYHWMTPDRLKHLLLFVKDCLAKKETKLQKPISATERVSLTLGFLATGEDRKLISFSYLIGRTTVPNILETCKAIFQSIEDRLPSGA